jgi:hypothetical protein
MLGRTLDLRTADGRTNLLVPQCEADTLLVLAPGLEGAPGSESTPGSKSAPALLPAFAEPLPALDVPLREEVGRYRFYRLPSGQSLAPPANAPARLANGVELLAAFYTQPPGPGRSTRMLLHWRVIEVPPNPPPQGYSFANHLLDKSGERIAQADGPGHRAALWRSGDTLISAFDLSLPADAPAPPYRLRVGMYVYSPPDQFTTIPVIDAHGTPIADAVEWPVP